ncbi:MAG: phosphoribosylanthranilate isomerase [Desulfovibrio sp.]|jgi:phosphoribosylanthranilate isomerase|nr:phosphoribosylanthranilate isomerase [Desulfovibrio sp.]
MLVKICGLTRQEDVDAASRFGADLCGFVFHPKSPRHITPERAAQLRSGAMRRVGVFVEQRAEEILRVMDVARLDFAQLHGGQSAECAYAVGPAKIIRVIWPGLYYHRALLYNELRKYAASCAMYLLDAGFSGGGSGNRLEWRDLAGLPAPRPWILAGGLNGRTVGRAVSQCVPACVDFNSGIEDAPGIKNMIKMRAAVKFCKHLDKDGGGV